MLKAPMRGRFLGFLDGKAVIAQGNQLENILAWDDASKAFRGNQNKMFHMVIGICSNGTCIIEADLLEDEEGQDDGSK